MTYQDLLEEAQIENVEVIDNCNIGGLKGMYVDDMILLNDKISCHKEKKCILAEELGHHHTTFGNILNQKKPDNRMQERKARVWAYEKLVTFDCLIKSYKAGIKNRYELSLFLEVTEEFLMNAIKYYKSKYGKYYIYDGFVIYFEPLGILKKEANNE